MRELPPEPRPSSTDRNSPDKEALFSFAWYHGAIPRDEAVIRLSAMGGFDGYARLEHIEPITLSIP